MNENISIQPSDKLRMQFDVVEKLKSFGPSFRRLTSVEGVFRGTVTLFIGGIIARLIAILSIFILTRLYSPADFGALAVFTAFLGILAPFLTFRYVEALPLPRREGLALNLLLLSAILLVIKIVLLAIIVWLAGETILSSIAMEILTPWRWLIVLALFSAGAYEILSMWATRRRDFKAIARAQIYQSLIGSIAKIILGFAEIRPLGLLLGHVLGFVAGIGGVARLFVRDFRSYKKHICWKRIRLVAISYKGMPFFRLPSQLLLAISMQSPLILTAALYDANTTGQFSLALMAMFLPITLLAHTTSRAYYAEIAFIGANNPAGIKKVTTEILRIMFFISILPTAIIFIYGEDLFSLAFGVDWNEAGRYASIMALYLLSHFLSAPIVKVFMVLRLENISLMINFQRLLLTAIAFFPAYQFNWPFDLALSTYTWVLFCHRCLMIFYILKILDKRCKNNIDV